MANEDEGWIVDREKQRQDFLKMHEGTKKEQIMVTKAGTQMGKTFLLKYLWYDFRSRNVPVAYVSCHDTQPADSLGILRVLCNQLGSDNFQHMDDVMEEIFKASIVIQSPTLAVNIKDANVTNSPIHMDMDEIKLAPASVPLIHGGSELAIRYQETKIIEAFFKCLKSLSEGQRVVILIDALEEASPFANEWYMSNLLVPIRNKELPRVLLFLAGQKVPVLDEEWKGWVTKKTLDNFTQDQVLEVLTKYGLNDNPKYPAAGVWSLSDGHPGLLNNIVDNAVRNEFGEEDEDWVKDDA